MQECKRGNPHRKPRQHERVSLPSVQPPERIRLSLHETDLITGQEEALYTLSYEYYRGYTIYSIEQGHCCIHGPGRRGCLRMRGKFVCFPDIEDAKNLIKYFRSQGVMSWESMERSVPEEEYVCVNRNEQHCPLPSLRSMQQVS